MFNRYFPQGVAEGEAFLGREDESARLQDNLSQGRHTLLLSPRRYGKTSLARHEIKKTGYDYAEIDLFLAVDERSIEARFLSGIEELIQKISTVPEQWIQTLFGFFKKSNKKWTIGMKGLKLELKPEDHVDIAGNVLLALQSLEYILSNKQKRAVLFVDEFQEINKVTAGQAIEGAVRHFAQASKFIVFIFSGSNRHLLTTMFGHRERPLYSLCDWIHLYRLDAALYESYINKIAKKTWDSVLQAEVIDEIIHLTECHPEEIYTLCGNIWQYCKQKNKTPTKADVTKVWKRYIKDVLKQTRLSLQINSAGQMRVLILIALNHAEGLTGKSAQKKINLTSPSIVAALNSLESNDFIERKDDGTYQIINPVIKDTLVEYYSDYMDQ